jgi:hypothetical protein
MKKALSNALWTWLVSYFNHLGFYTSLSFTESSKLACFAIYKTPEALNRIANERLIVGRQRSDAETIEALRTAIRDSLTSDSVYAIRMPSTYGKLMKLLAETEPVKYER